MSTAAGVSSQNESLEDTMGSNTCSSNYDRFITFSICQPAWVDEDARSGLRGESKSLQRICQDQGKS